MWDATGAGAEFFDQRIPGDERGVFEVRASGRIPGRKILADGRLGLGAQGKVGTSAFLEARERITGRRRGDEMGVSRNVQLDSPAAIVAGVRELRGSSSICEMGRTKTSNGGTVAARGVWHARGTRAELPLGR